MDTVDNISRYLWNELVTLKKEFDEIIEVRGAGLLLGIKTKSSNLEINKLFETHGLLTIPASDNVIRLSPPLIINKNGVDIAIQIIRKALTSI